MRNRSLGRAAACTLAVSLAPSYARAAAVIAPPGDPAYDPTIAALAAGYQLQQDTFAALEMGLSLDVDVTASEVATVKAFFAQTSTTDFKAFSGKPPFAVLDQYDEYGDIGNFAGVASVGVAARLLALEAEGAPSAEVATARAAAVRAAQAWHVYGAIAGDGVIARGIQRTTPLEPATTGPLPGTVPATVPLKDAKGAPLPNPKAGVWRAPVASGFDGWIWMDDTSKDQVSGYALAAAWLWDALVDDPLVDPAVPAALAADLAAFARALMRPSPEYDGIDLCLRDADGRLTDAHDLNPRQITPTGVVPKTSALQNGFNAAMALGVIRAAYHVSGDPVVGRYYYDELVKKRGYPEMFSDAAFIFMGPSTNYSNVNMLAISYALLSRFETDPILRAKYAKAVETTFWSTGSSYDVSHVQQAWYDVVYGAASAHPTAALRQRVANNLAGFPVPPAFHQDRVNCTPGDIAKGSCLGIDGKTMITLASGAGHGGGVEASEVVPMAIRPMSDFEWRSDPHDVNGTGSPSVMNPGGDFLAAYWLGRVIDLDDAAKNLTPHPRAPYVDPDAGAVKPDASTADAAQDASPASSHPSSGASSCGCTVAGAAGGPAWAAVAGLALVAVRRSRRRSKVAA